MKNYIYCVVSAFVILSCDKEEPTLDLNGVWIGIGYNCPANQGNYIDEEVEIVHSGNTIIATKITGSDCVPSGEITFEGEFVDERNATITWTLGKPTDPSCCTSTGTLFVEENWTLRTTFDEYDDRSITFIRTDHGSQN